MSETQSPDRVHESIVDAAEVLLREQGASGLTTRAVAQAAGVQAPTIYRHIGDKDGLIDAIAERVMTTYVADNAAPSSHRAAELDPVTDLRDGWKMHIDFALANSELYALLNAPGRRDRSPATAAGVDVLRSRVHRLATSGLLRVDQERAVMMIHAAGAGAAFTLLQLPSDERDAELADAMLEALLGHILVTPRAGDDPSVSTAAVTLKAMLPDLPALTDAERQLMAEWLTRSLNQTQ